MCHVNKIRVVSGKYLPAGMALHTGLCRPLLAKQAEGKCVSQGFPSHTCLAAQYISMGNLPCLHCVAEMFLYLFMS